MCLLPLLKQREFTFAYSVVIWGLEGYLFEESGMIL